MKIRTPVAFLSLLAAVSVWSTAAAEIAAILYLTAVLTENPWHRAGRLFSPKTNNGRWNPIFIAACFWTLYLVGTLVSISASAFTDQSTVFLLRQWHLLLFPATIMAGFSLDELILVECAGLFSGSLAALAGIVWFLMGHGERLDYPFLGAMTYGTLLVVTVIPAIGWGLTSISPGKREKPGPQRPHALTVWLLLASLPIVVAVFMTTLRGPIIALFLASIALVLFIRPRLIVVWLAGALAMVFLSPFPLIAKIRWIIEGRPLDRYVAWNAGFRLLKSVPLFGYGPDSFAQVLPANAWVAFMNRPPASWHNDLLQTILDCGWITGIALVLLLCTVLIPSLLRLRREQGTDRRGFLLLPLLLGTVISLSLANSVISSAVLGIVFWIILGLTTTATTTGISNEQPR